MAELGSASTLAKPLIGLGAIGDWDPYTLRSPARPRPAYRVGTTSLLYRNPAPATHTGNGHHGLGGGLGLGRRVVDGLRPWPAL